MKKIAAFSCPIFSLFSLFYFYIINVGLFPSYTAANV